VLTITVNLSLIDHGIVTDGKPTDSKALSVRHPLYGFGAPEGWRSG
jgi:hypothetical protein